MGVDYWTKASVIVAASSLTIYILGYILSGIIDAFRTRRRIYDLLVWDPSKEILSKFYIVHEEGSDIYDYVDGKLLICSEKMIYDVVASAIVYSNDKFFKTEEIFRYNYLTPDEAILFSTTIPETIPNVKIEWISESYMKGSVLVAYNGKVGNIVETVIYTPTFKSILFSIFKRGE